MVQTPLIELYPVWQLPQNYGRVQVIQLVSEQTGSQTCKFWDVVYPVSHREQVVPFLQIAQCTTLHWAAEQVKLELTV